MTRLSPDLRAATVSAVRGNSPLSIGSAAVTVEAPLPSQVLPSYLVFHHREAEVVASGVGNNGDIAGLLEGYLRDGAPAADIPDMFDVVTVLSAWDELFRSFAIFDGNVYVGGHDSLRTLMGMAAPATSFDADTLLAELQALELVYQFPMARKFRGGYDGVTQFRLNGWGRSLAALLATSPAGAARATDIRSLLAQHIDENQAMYSAHMERLPTLLNEDSEQAWREALALPVAVLT